MKLIGLDIDGTLINSRKEISEKTKITLIKAMKEGHKVVIVTGRPTPGARELADILDFKKYGGLLSTYNGGAITDCKENKTLTSHPMDMKLAREIVAFSKNLDLEIILPYEETIYSRAKGKYAVSEAKNVNMNLEVIENLEDVVNFCPNKILFAQDPDRIDEPIKNLKEKFGEETEQMKSARYFYEVMPKGPSKGKSLLEIAEIFDIDQKDIIAFGDEMNDISMLEMAGVGVAMGNAVPKIKEIADYITLSNDEDGIAYYLERFVL